MELKMKEILMTEVEWLDSRDFILVTKNNFVYSKGGNIVSGEMPKLRVDEILFDTDCGPTGVDITMKITVKASRVK